LYLSVNCYLTEEFWPPYWGILLSFWFGFHNLWSFNEIIDSSIFFCLLCPSEKLDDKKLSKYVRQYIDDIFEEFVEQPSIHLILINIDNIFSIFFNILQYINKCYIISENDNNQSIFFNIYQYINKCYVIDGKKIRNFLNTFTGGWWYIFYVI
jgi:hypothetical protein